MKKSIILISTLLLLFANCDNNKKNNDEISDDKQIVSNIVEKIILAENQNFYDDAIKLHKATEEFISNTTVGNLEKVRTQWFKVAKDWARCYAFNIGAVRKGRFFRYFATFPVNTLGLETKIEQTDLEDINKKYVLDQLGLDNKGLYGIEYFIYKENPQQTVQTFEANPKRKKILQLIVEEFVNDVNNFHSKWEEFAPQLIANEESKESSENSLNLIFGGIDNVINYAWETKIGKAIRKNDIEAGFSKKSLELVRENIAITKKVYFDGGFALKMKEIMKSDKWNNKTKERYKKIEGILNSIRSPLSEAVKNDEKPKLRQLIDELQGLTMSEFSKVKTVLNLVGGPKEGDGD